MVRTLNDTEVVRLIKKHCTLDEQRFFRRISLNKPALVALVLNNELREGPHAEREVLQRIRCAICQLKNTGDC